MSQPEPVHLNQESLERKGLELKFVLWHNDPMTQRFFAALKQRAQDRAFSAALKASRTGPNNAAEHNNLVRVNEILKIADTYGDPKQYPY